MFTTIGVLSILEGALRDEVRRLWKLFETMYASKGVQSFDYPNVSFQGGYCYNLSLVKEAVSEMSRHLSPFEVITDGIGYFESPSKVVFLNVRLTEELRRINRTVNSLLKTSCESVFEHYLPGTWKPHITVAMDDLTDQNFERAKQDLCDYPARYQQILSKIQLVRVDDKTGRVTIIKSYAIGESSEQRNEKGK